jgi:hypothetical protein
MASLQRAARELLTSEGWQRWVQVRSRAGLVRQSLSYQLLVALARPDATFVAGFKSCLRLGYCVRKGEKAIRIIAPLLVKERDRGPRRSDRLPALPTLRPADAHARTGARRSALQ